MSSPDKPLIVSRYQVQKDNLVSFNCPACDDGIVTNLKDATKLGLCPKCRVQFVSPGTKELESLRKAHQAKLQAQKVELAEASNRRSSSRCSKLSASESNLRQRRYSNAASNPVGFKTTHSERRQQVTACFTLMATTTFAARAKNYSVRA